ncbi:hypothetical protein EH11_04353 [Bacillus subtilis]|nr:hypothetical protein EH11_04353 [Bacillus subtilis]RUS03097.1 hypothetical protein EFW59_04347 [Bacillus subtilis]CCU59766.1 hypothetical protein BSUBE1_3135 [Bacillus subtilis E1]
MNKNESYHDFYSETVYKQTICLTPSSVHSVLFLCGAATFY